MKTLTLPLIVAAALLALAACDKTGNTTANAAAASNAAMNAAPAAAAPATNGVVAPATGMAVAPVGGGGKFKAVKEACAADLQKLCANADKPGKCLKEHEGELTPACGAAFSAFRAARKAERAAKGE